VFNLSRFGLSSNVFVATNVAFRSAKARTFAERMATLSAICFATTPKLTAQPRTEAELAATGRCVARGQPCGGEPRFRRTAEPLGLESTLQGCEKTGLAPSGNGENRGKPSVAKVPVPPLIS
jgi:hypothetical protein